MVGKENHRVTAKQRDVTNICFDFLLTGILLINSANFVTSLHSRHVEQSHLLFCSLAALESRQAGRNFPLLLQRTPQSQ